MMDDIYDQLASFDVVSFDVFDTLLLRSYLTQEDLWRDLGMRELGEKGGVAFLKARIAADRRTYGEATRRGGEHTLAQAYARMPRRYAALLPKEEALQRDCLVANPALVRVWRRAGELGKRRIIVSDMYLSEAWFAETLKVKGFGDYDALYVSSARQARKSSGQLFQVVLRDLPAAKILHIGDNVHSDVKMAQAAGLAAHHYQNLREGIMARMPFLAAYLKDHPAFRKNLLVGRLVLQWSLSESDGASSYWRRVGFFFGGTLGHLFATWLAEQVAAQGISHLMFVARDGYLWKQMFDALGTGVRTDYFYAPRAVSVKVLGAVGSDPGAVADRQCYMEAHRGEYDSVAELRRYREYLSAFAIDDRTAVVDGCSSAFSVQRLVGAAVGREVPALYLMTLDKAVTGATLYTLPLLTFPWQPLVEFIFSSPEAPIDDVDVKGPKYRAVTHEFERFRERVFPELEAGAKAGFSVLRSCRCEFTKRDWLDWYAAFARNPTAEDRDEFASAGNATNVNQDNFSPIVIEMPPRIRVTRKFGIPFGQWHRDLTEDGIVETFWLFSRWRIRSKGDLDSRPVRTGLTRGGANG